MAGITGGGGFPHLPDLSALYGFDKGSFASDISGGNGSSGGKGESSEPIVRWRAWLFCGAVVNLVISVAFGLVHSGSPGWTLLSLVNIALSSATYGLLFVLQGNLLGA